MIRILHVMPTFHPCSITDIVQNIIDGTDQAEYEWHISAPGRGDTQEEFKNMGAFTFNYINSGMRGFKRILNMGIAARNLRDYIKKHDIQLVHTHTSTTTILAWMAMFGSKEIKRLYTKHYLDIPKDRGWFYTIVDHASLYQTDYLIPVSRTMGSQLEAHIGLHKSRIFPIQNSIDHVYFYTPDERDDTRQEFGFEPQDVVFGFTGRLEKVKRIDLLLDVFSRVYPNHPEARLLIVGKGSLEHELKAKAEQLNISEGVLWAGWRTDISRLLASMDVYVQPSDNEGLSLSVLEAMAARKAVIATTVGGISEVIEHGVSGLLIPPNDSQAMEEAFNEYLRDAQKREQIATYGREFIATHFDKQRMVSAYDNLYKQCYNGD